MGKSNSYSKKQKVENSRIKDIIRWVPFAAVLAVVPLIVRLKVYDNMLIDFDFMDNLAKQVDFFLYYKALWFVIISLVLAILIVHKYVTDKKSFKFTPLLAPVAVYALGVLLSSIFSSYPDLAFSGCYEQFEYAWVYLGYAVVVYYGYLFMDSEQTIRKVLAMCTVGVIIELLIGLTQAFSSDIFKTRFGRFFSVPFSQIDNADAMVVTVPDGTVYMTLSNSNYVGTYVTLLCPLFLMLIFTTKKRVLQALYIGIFAGLILALWGSGSRAGFVGVVVSFIVLMIVFNRNLIKNWFPVSLILVILLGTAYTMNNYTDFRFTNRIKSAFNVSEEKAPDLSAIDIEGDKVVFTYKGEKLSVNYSDIITTIDGKKMWGYKFECFDGNGNVIETEDYNVDACIDRISSEGVFKGILLGVTKFEDVSDYGFYVKIDNKQFTFINYGDTCLYYTPYGKFVSAVDTKSESFEPLLKYAHFASGRGFIWSKTIPLLKKRIFLGSGPDTYVAEFPNNDWLSRINYGFPDKLISKPHNQYLQMWVETGLISLLAYLTFYIMYAVTALKLIWRRKTYDYYALIEIGILCGSAGYLVVQFINDSQITVAPIFWALMGIGCGILNKLKSEQTEVKAATK